MPKKISPSVLVQYWGGLGRSEKAELATGLNTSVGYLRQVFLYGRQPGALRARALSEKTGLAAFHFRPDVFSNQSGSIGE